MIKHREPWVDTFLSPQASDPGYSTGAQIEQWVLGHSQLSPTSRVLPSLFVLLLRCSGVEVTGSNQIVQAGNQKTPISAKCPSYALSGR